jgi:hypothetical protein
MIQVFSPIFTQWIVTTAAIAILVLFVIFLYNKRKLIRFVFFKKWNVYYTVFALSIVAFYYRVQLLSLINNPPSWAFLIAGFLYYLTILSNSNKEKVDSFKEQTVGLKSTAEEIQKDITEVNKQFKVLVDKTKLLSIKNRGVDKMAKTLTATSTSLQSQVDNLSLGLETLNNQFTSLQQDVAGLTTDVKEIKELLKQLLERK